MWMDQCSGGEGCDENIYYTITCSCVYPATAFFSETVYSSHGLTFFGETVYSSLTPQSFGETVYSSLISVLATLRVVVEEDCQ